MKKNLLLILLIFVISCSTNSGRVMSSAELTGYKYIDRARRDIKRADIENALKNLDLALDLSHKNNLPYLKAQVYLEKSVILAKFSSDLAEKHLQLAEEIINKESKELEPYLIINKSMFLYSKGNKDEAKKLLEKVDKIPKDIRNYYILFQAIIAKDENRQDDFEKLSNQALKYSLKDEDYYLSSYLYKLKASNSENKGDIDNAIKYFKKALEIDRIVNNNKQTLYTLEALGDLYTKLGDKDNAFYYYYQGWELLSSFGDYKNSQKFLEKALSTLN